MQFLKGLRRLCFIPTHICNGHDGPDIYQNSEVLLYCYKLGCANLRQNAVLFPVTSLYNFFPEHSPLFIKMLQRNSILLKNENPSWNRSYLNKVNMWKVSSQLISFLSSAFFFFFFFGDLRLFKAHLSFPFSRLNSVISFFFELISSQWSGDFIAKG